MTRVLTGVRASLMARCPCMAAVDAITPPEEKPEPSPRMRRFFARGQMFGGYVASQFEAKYGVEDVERERAIVWGDGRWTGHADIYVRSLKLIVEVVSSTGEQIIPTKMRQAKQYEYWDPEAERAAVYHVNPSDLDREDLYPVELTEQDKVSIDADTQAVIRAVDGGPLPPCVASSPEECRTKYMCAYTDIVWAGWTPPQRILNFDNDDEVAELARELYLLKQRRGEIAARDAAEKVRQKEIEEQLVEAGVAAGLDYTLGSGLKLRRVTQPGRETFRRQQAVAAGLWGPVEDERFSAYLRIGEPYETFRVSLTGDAPVPTDDYGPVPF